MLSHLKKNRLFQFFASLKLAVFSLLSLATILATATILESLYGTRAAYVFVYGTWWFAGVLLMLGSNVFCAAAIRFPWKRHQTGFAITHAGILTILVGSLLTQQLGVDGNLPVVEGQQDGEVILNDLTLTLADEDRKRSEVFDLPVYALRRSGRLVEINLPGDRRLVLDDYLPRAIFEKKLVKSPLPGVGLPAMRIELFNSRFRLEEWLQAQPEKAAELNLGPAVLYFKKLWTKEQEANFTAPPAPAKPVKASKLGYIIAQYQGKELRIDIADAMKGKWLPIGGTPLSVHLERYMPYAIVENNELVNKSDEPVNPAIQLKLRDTAGGEEQHTLFANFPEFATLHKAHQQPGQKPLGAKLKMIAAGAHKEAGAGGTAGMGRGQLHFAQTADGKRLLYFSKGKAGDMKAQGTVKLNEPMPTGWMDLQFRVTEWLDAAVEEESPRYIEFIQGGDANFLTGIRMHVEEGPRVADAGVPGVKSASAKSSDNEPDHGFWLMEGSGRPISVGGRELFVQFAKRRMTLPFQLHLEKFTMGTDPGTTKAATYESQVSVKDPMGGEGKKALISMNEPLVYGGYTFYQASYQMEEGRPPVSIFSVNYDPGRPVKYAGSLIMVFGIIIMFWWNPHYFGKIAGVVKKKEEVAS